MSAQVTYAGGMPAPAGTFVYVSNAADGDIATFSMQPASGKNRAVAAHRPAHG